MQGDKMDTTCAQIMNEKNMYVSKLNISDLAGVQYFDKLEVLSCDDNKLTQLPPLPVGLKHLSCWSNNLISLPVLPPSVLTLSCGHNALTELPVLPVSLESLHCPSNQLTMLPSLPNSIFRIDCSENLLTFLPALPQSLTDLMCLRNQLTVLPSLPSALTYLRCDYNQLAALPALPAALRYINANVNSLTILPLLPQGLETLLCSDNQLKQLPVLPPALSGLSCSNNQLTALPYLPASLQALGCENNKLTDLPYLPESLTVLACRINKIMCLPVLPNALTDLVTDSICRPNLPPHLAINIPFNAPLCSALTFTHTRECAGDSTRFDQKVVNCHAFLWDFDDPVTGAHNTSTLKSPKHLFSKPGTFHVKLISYVTDPATEIIQTVIVDKLPRIDFGDDHSMCPDDGITLDAGKDFESYLWQDGSAAQTYAVKTPGMYSVTATNACGSVSDAVRLNAYELTVPNLFTPNKDGLNETFEIAGLDGDAGSLQVYNSWGAEVFAAERYYNNWNGEGLPEGVYYYSFRLKSCPVEKGWVQIMR